MRIAIVGKGGSGKTTVSALFASFLAKKKMRPLIIDADINIHQPELHLESGNFDKEKWLSNAKNTTFIKSYLRNKNTRISSLGAFRKTTPPAEGSQFFPIYDKQHLFFQKLALPSINGDIMVVGTYTADGIGTSCYHNNLAVLENMLSHMVDRGEVVIVDMVAGVDAFAGSLHAQFDMVVLVIEPTKRSIEVWKQYEQLAKKAGVADYLFAVGNKCQNDDAEFLQQQIGGRLLGVIGYSAYLKSLEKKGDIIDIHLLEPESQLLFAKIFQQLQRLEQDPNERVKKLYKLHHAYVAQDFIRTRFGDLTGQIDPDFTFPCH